MASWPHEYCLFSPFYPSDLIAMVLLLYGAIRSLRARPRPAPGILVRGLRLDARHGWRATWVVRSNSGTEETLDYGAVELWVVGARRSCP